MECVGNDCSHVTNHYDQGGGSLNTVTSNAIPLAILSFTFTES